jgi:hypothetical protein
MPGLVKVGKTTRDPDQRADELSSVTGVATPFVVAFQQHFADCDAAEDFIHVRLQECGYRESSNREFFRARANDVIRIVGSSLFTVGRNILTPVAAGRVCPPTDRP